MGNKKGNKKPTAKKSAVGKKKTSNTKPKTKGKQAPSRSSSPAKAKTGKKTVVKTTVFPDKFPFWARLKISKNRTTLVIDEEPVVNKKTKKTEDGFVHRESIHTKKKDYEEIKPNPDKDDQEPMYLKRPRKLPKRMFKPHEKNLDMPKHLKEKYEKNNKK